MPDPEPTYNERITEAREQVRAECPPDLEKEHSSDWYPEPDLV